MVKDLLRDVVDRHGVRVVMLDLDGVVYRGPRAVAGAAACVNALMARGVRVLYVTNNAARSGAFFRAKLCALGVDGALLRAQDAAAPVVNALMARGVRVLYVTNNAPVVYTSGTAAALCLLHRASPFNRRYAAAAAAAGTALRTHLDVYALAEAGFAEEFAAVHAHLARTAPAVLQYATATVHGGAADSARTLDVQGGAEPVVADAAVAAVVVFFVLRRGKGGKGGKDGQVAMGEIPDASSNMTLVPVDMMSANPDGGVIFLDGAQAQALTSVSAVPAPAPAPGSGAPVTSSGNVSSGGVVSGVPAGAGATMMMSQNMPMMMMTPNTMDGMGMNTMVVPMPMTVNAMGTPTGTMQAVPAMPMNGVAPMPMMAMPMMDINGMVVMNTTANMSQLAQQVQPPADPSQQIPTTQQ